MVGNFGPCLKALSCENRRYYKSIYCGLCRIIKRYVGIFSTLCLVNDAVFLSLLIPFGRNDKPMASRCIVNPFMATCHLPPDHPVIESAFWMNTVFVVCKYVDDYMDGTRSLWKPRIMKPFLSRYDRAFRVIPVGIEEIYDCMREQAERECEDVDCYSYFQPVGDFSARMFGLVLGKYHDIVLLHSLGRLYAEMVTLYDGIKDCREDRKTGVFNIFNRMQKEIGIQETFCHIHQIAHQFLYIAMHICPEENKELLRTAFITGFLKRVRNMEKVYDQNTEKVARHKSHGGFFFLKCK